MISIWYFARGLGSQTLALSLIIVMMTTTVLTTAITIFSPALVQSAFAEHGQEIVLTSKDTSFAPISSGEGNQVKVAVNYAVHDPMVANDLVKGVMKVYSPDGTLLKTSSSPNPFPITNSHGTVTLATTLTDPTIEDVIAKIVFTNPIKTEIISNELPVSINLIKDAAMTGEPKERAIFQVPQVSESKEEDEPLPDDKLLSTESPKESSKIEEEQQSARIEDVPTIHQSPQLEPTESMPQTLTNSYVSPPPPPPPIIPEPEICNDSFDNDGDTLIDLSDFDCNLIQTQQQRPPVPQQQQSAMVSSPEICDDDLDNDLDSKVDSRDEECSSITSGTSSLSSPGEAQSVAGKQAEETKNDDKEQQPERDLSEDAVEKEESDRGDNNDENSNEEENEDEDDDDEE
jgi:hypothetical protein